MYRYLDPRTVRDALAPTARLESVTIMRDFLQLLHVPPVVGQHCIATVGERILAGLMKASLLGVCELANVWLVGL